RPHPPPRPVLGGRGAPRPRRVLVRSLPPPHVAAGRLDRGGRGDHLPTGARRATDGHRPGPRSGPSPLHGATRRGGRGAAGGGERPVRPVGRGTSVRHASPPSRAALVPAAHRRAEGPRGPPRGARALPSHPPWSPAAGRAAPPRRRRPGRSSRGGPVR